MTVPDLSGEPGWQPLAPFWEITGTRSFVSYGDRLRAGYFQSTDGAVACHASGLFVEIADGGLADVLSRAQSAHARPA